jgi:cellulose biosynthesis protein BcsQ
MKMILIASASGGSAKTTTCVRLAEALGTHRRRGVVVDLSPYPTAGYLVAAEGGVDIVRGRAATTPVAAASFLKPFEAPHAVALLDIGRLDDPALDPWMPMVTDILLTTRCTEHAVAALPGLWSALQARREKYPSINFLGFLPVLFKPEQEGQLRLLRQASRNAVAGGPIPFDPREVRRCQETIFKGLAPFPDTFPDLSNRAYGALALELAERLGVEARAPEPAESGGGLFTRLWKKAADAARSVRIRRDVGESLA